MSPPQSARSSEAQRPEGDEPVDSDDATSYRLGDGDLRIEHAPPGRNRDRSLERLVDRAPSRVGIDAALRARDVSRPKR